MLPLGESDFNSYTMPSYPSLPTSTEGGSMKRSRSQAELAIAADTASEAIALVEINEFCHQLGSRLRALDPKTRVEVQFQILQIIADAESGEL